MTKDFVHRIPSLGFWLLLIYMPFHLFLAQSLSQITGGLEVWKVAKDIVLAALVVFTICLVWKQGKATKTFWWLVAAASAYLALHAALWLGNYDGTVDRSALLGMVYNLRLPAFLLLGYGATLLTPRMFAFSSLFKIGVGVSSLVAILGILQYFLPPDILAHAGYSIERGARPAFFIDDNPDLPRIMSTLREPNALGAFLLVPLAALAAIYGGLRLRWHQITVAALIVVHGVAIVLTQSRSAWLAAVVTLVIIGWVCYRQIAWRLLRRWWWVGAVAALLLTIVVVTQHQSPFFQRYIVHGNPDETVADLDSNDYHWLLVKEGWDGALKQPLGHGPGTAGLASIQNPGGTKLTENYYVQLAYEVGLSGMVLFVAGNIWVVVRLWRRGDTLGVVLVASAGGYFVTNMLLHTWSNEAVAAQWWLLAGVALALPRQVPRAQKAAKAKSKKTKPVRV